MPKTLCAIHLQTYLRTDRRTHLVMESASLLKKLSKILSYRGYARFYKELDLDLRRYRIWLRIRVTGLGNTPMAAMVDLMVSWIGPRWSSSNSNRAIGPIRDTIKSTIAATEIGE